MAVEVDERDGLDTFSPKTQAPLPSPREAQDGRSALL